MTADTMILQLSFGNDDLTIKRPQQMSDAGWYPLCIQVKNVVLAYQKQQTELAVILSNIDGSQSLKTN